MILSLVLTVTISFVVFAILTKRPTGMTVPPLVSANSLVGILFVLYVIFPTILVLANGGVFTWATAYSGYGSLNLALLVSLVAALSFWVGSIVSGRDSKQSRGRSAKEVAKPAKRPVVVVALILVAIGLGLKLYIVVLNGGLQDAILRLSGGVANSTDTALLDADSIGLRTTSGLADGAATWLLVEAMRSHKRLLPWVAIFASTELLSFLTVGKRLALFLPFLAIVLAVQQYRRRLTVRALPVLLIGAVLFGMLSLFARIFVPAAVANAPVDLESVSYSGGGSPLLFYFYSLEFSTVEMISVCVQSAHDIASLFPSYGDMIVQTNLAPFAYTVPRSVWAGKPDMFTDFSYAVASVVNNADIADSTVGYVPTLVGTSFVVAGVPGVIIGFLILGALCARVDRVFGRMDWSSFRLLGTAILLMFVFHLFRMGTVAWTFLIAVVQQYGFLVSFGILLACAALWRSGDSGNLTGRAWSKRSAEFSAQAAPR